MTDIKLEKGIIHLMLPFRLRSATGSDIINMAHNVWEPTGEDIPRLDFLLEHVKKFFANNAGSTTVDESACLIMKLKTNTVPVKMFNNKLFWVSNKSFDNNQGARNRIKFPVYIDPGAFRLIIHPYTRSGLLTFSIELVKESKTGKQPNLEDFINMNYLLRLFNRHDEAYVISVNDRSEERKKSLMLISGKPELIQTDDKSDIETKGWRPGHLVNYLLNDLNAIFKVELFDHFHFSPVSFVQPSEEIIDEEFINRTLFYLRKVYDFDYDPATAVLQKPEELLHPYRQIFYASSLEGAAVLNNCKSTDPEFIRSYYSNSFYKTLWLTVLCFLQRSIFLQLLKEVSDIDPDDHQKVKEYLRRYTTISLKAIFSKVSVFHQHNDYYDLIIYNLQIGALQNELKEELHELNNLQRQFHEDEVEKHEEIEKLYDKRLSMILFALSIFGLAQITYAAIGAKSMSILEHILAIGIPVVLGIIFWRMFISRKK